MTRRRSVLTLAVTLLAVLASLWFVQQPNEADVYLATLAPFSNNVSVMVSRPTTCELGADEISALGKFPEELPEKFLTANGQGKSPVSLVGIKGHFAIADEDSVDDYLHAGISRNAALRGRPLIFLSRVGFSKDGKGAMFCFGNLGYTWLAYSRLRGGQWQQEFIYSLRAP